VLITQGSRALDQHRARNKNRQHCWLLPSDMVAIVGLSMELEGMFGKVKVRSMFGVPVE